MFTRSNALGTCTLVLMVAVAACTGKALDGPGASTDGGSLRDFSSTTDFASTIDFASAIDLASSGPDLTSVGTEGCANMLICADECNGTAACTGACLAMGTIAAQNEFNAILGCGYAACMLGGVPCTSTADQSMSCLSCVSQAAQSMSCASELSACLND
jgi:hypothetical protein